MKLLIGKGASANCMHLDDMSLVQWIVDTINPDTTRDEIHHLETLELLIRNGADVNAPSFRFAYGPLPSAIHAAVDKNLVEVVKLFCLHGNVDFFAQGDPHKVTPIVLAAQKGHSEVLKVLLAEGAESTNRKKWIENLQAAWRGVLRCPFICMASVIEILLDAGVEPDQPINSRSNDNLLLALLSRHPQAIEKLIPIGQLLLTRGLDVNATNQEGNTALHLAASCNKDAAIKMVRLLVENGANCHQRAGGRGEIPLEVARRVGKVVDVIQFLSN